MSLVLPLLLLAFSAPGAATPRCMADAGISPADGSPPIEDSDDTTGSCTSGVDDGINFVFASGEASLGTLRARAEATFADPTLFDDAGGGVSAQHRDSITLSSPGLEGERVFVVARTFLTGFIDLTGNARAQVSLGLFASSPFFADCVGGSSCLGVPGYPVFFSEFVDTSFGITVGQPTEFVLSLSTAVLPGGSLDPIPGSADVDFSNTAEWAGIQEVTYEGSPVSFTIDSEGGFDYVTPVPEPSQAALLLAAAAALAIRGRGVAPFGSRASPSWSPGSRSRVSGADSPSKRGCG